MYTEGTVEGRKWTYLLYMRTEKCSGTNKQQSTEKEL